MKIVAPTSCPSCGSILTQENYILFCRNPDCGTQASKKLEHFAKSMKIKGLGPATIQKLEITSIKELYNLTLEDLKDSIGSEKIAEKLFTEIKNSLNAPLEQLLASFSIPLVGKTASNKLAKVCNDIFDITEEKCRQAGLGAKTTNNYFDWFSLEYPNIANIPFSFRFSEQAEVSKKAVVCISGKLISYKTKAEATKVLNAYGYEVKSNLTKEVDILINESGIDSLKTKQANKLGIEIITDIKQLIGEK